MIYNGSIAVVQKLPQSVLPYYNAKWTMKLPEISTYDLYGANIRQESRYAAALGVNSAAKKAFYNLPMK